MIVGIDIGGTKTLVALCDLNGNIKEKQKFETPKNYTDFIAKIKESVADIGTKSINLTVVAVPGKINRKTGTGLKFGNLPWQDVAIAKDIARITKSGVIIENDANLAGLAESRALPSIPNKVLYITVSTGIGTGIITNGYISPALADSESGSLLICSDNKLITWEKLTSGQAIKKQYGLKASEINDSEIWKKISHNLAIGIVDLCSLIQPDLIIIGGGVGTYFYKYKAFLKKAISDIKPQLVDIPEIINAKHPEEAVIYGCIELAKQHEKHLI